MDEEDASADGNAPEPAPAAAPGGDSRLISVSLLAIAGWTAAGAFGVAPLVALAGAGGTIAAALIVGRGAERRPPAPVVPVRRPRVWPDTGMKVMLDIMDAPAFLTDASGTMRYQNAAAVREFGQARLGDPLSFKLRVPDVLEAVARTADGALAAPVRFIDRGKFERHFIARVNAVRLPSGAGRTQPDFILIEMRDETERVRLDRMRGDFIANASHELRTPLASLTGFIETLLGPARRDEVNRERFLGIMLEQAQRMGRLIDDLMSLSRVEMRSHLRPSERVDLVAVAATVADMLEPVAAQKGITVDVTEPEEPAFVRGDRDELTQLGVNLAENAIKYGRPDGSVRIAVDRAPGPDGVPGYRLTVADDGPGIAAEHIPRLTERFYRVDAARSREQKGTGLGLAIVKHVVNRHQGQLQIRSEVGRGTDVHVWLPDYNGEL